MNKAVCKELELQKDYLNGETIETIYFGGGTPSIFSYHQLEKVVDTIYRHYEVDSDIEFTLEANPDDLTSDHLLSLKAMNINRLSIGIQTFDDDILKFLNRAHDSHQAIYCIENARNAGFDNISIDLIYGIKEDDHHSLKCDVKTALSLTPEHISAYCLTIEPKTAFGNWQKKGKLKTVSEEYAASQFEILIDKLGEKKYEQYEISNFASEERYSRHNTSYWRNKKYLGIGPSAHSFDGESRQFNISNNVKYIRSVLEEGRVPFEKEILDPKNRVNEMLMTGLRTKWGCDLNLLKSQFDFDLKNQHGKEIAKYHDKDLIRIEDEKIFLTQKGKLLADEITADLLWV